MFVSVISVYLETDEGVTGDAVKVTGNAIVTKYTNKGTIAFDDLENELGKKMDCSKYATVVSGVRTSEQSGWQRLAVMGNPIATSSLDEKNINDLVQKLDKNKVYPVGYGSPYTDSRGPDVNPHNLDISHEAFFAYDDGTETGDAPGWYEYSGGIGRVVKKESLVEYSLSWRKTLPNERRNVFVYDQDHLEQVQISSTPKEDLNKLVSTYTPEQAYNILEIPIVVVDQTPSPDETSETDDASAPSTSEEPDVPDTIDPTRYVVASGDILNKIAEENGITVQELLYANPQITNPDNIYPGDIIKIPEIYLVSPWWGKVADFFLGGPAHAEEVDEEGKVYVVISDEEKQPVGDIINPEEICGGKENCYRYFGGEKDDSEAPLPAETDLELGTLDTDSQDGAGQAPSDQDTMPTPFSYLYGSPNIGSDYSGIEFNPETNAKQIEKKIGNDNIEISLNDIQMQEEDNELFIDMRIEEDQGVDLSGYALEITFKEEENVQLFFKGEDWKNKYSEVKESKNKVVRFDPQKDELKVNEYGDDTNTWGVGLKSFELPFQKLYDSIKSIHLIKREEVTTRTYLDPAWEAFVKEDWNEVIKQADLMINNHPEWLEEAKRENMEIDPGAYLKYNKETDPVIKEALFNEIISNGKLNDIGVIYFHKSVAHAKLNQKEEAEAASKELLKNFPNSQALDPSQDIFWSVTESNEKQNKDADKGAKERIEQESSQPVTDSETDETISDVPTEQQEDDEPEEPDVNEIPVSDEGGEPEPDIIDITPEPVSDEYIYLRQDILTNDPDRTSAYYRITESGIKEELDYETGTWKEANIDYSNLLNLEEIKTGKISWIFRSKERTLFGYNDAELELDVETNEVSVNLLGLFGAKDVSVDELPNIRGVNSEIITEAKNEQERQQLAHKPTEEQTKSAEEARAEKEEIDIASEIYRQEKEAEEQEIKDITYSIMKPDLEGTDYDGWVFVEDSGYAGGGYYYSPEGEDRLSLDRINELLDIADAPDELPFSEKEEIAEAKAAEREEEVEEELVEVGLKEEEPAAEETESTETEETETSEDELANEGGESEDSQQLESEETLPPQIELTIGDFEGEKIEYGGSEYYVRDGKVYENEFRWWNPFTWFWDPEVSEEEEEEILDELKDERSESESKMMAVAEPEEETDETEKSEEEGVVEDEAEKTEQDEETEKSETDEGEEVEKGGGVEGVEVEPKSSNEEPTLMKKLTGMTWDEYMASIKKDVEIHVQTDEYLENRWDTEGAYIASKMVLNRVLGDFAYGFVSDYCKSEWDSSESADGDSPETVFDSSVPQGDIPECNGISATTGTAQYTITKNNRYVYDLSWTLKACKQDLTYSVYMNPGGFSVHSGSLKIGKTAAEEKALHLDNLYDNICIDTNDMSFGVNGITCFEPPSLPDPQFDEICESLSDFEYSNSAAIMIAANGYDSLSEFFQDAGTIAQGLQSIGVADQANIYRLNDLFDTIDLAAIRESANNNCDYSDVDERLTIILDNDALSCTQTGYIVELNPLFIIKSGAIGNIDSLLSDFCSYVEEIDFMNPPVPEITTQDIVTLPGNITFEFRINDEEYPVDYELLWNYLTVATSSVTDNSVHSHTLNLPNGNWIVQIKATDKRGNIGYSNILNIILNDTIDVDFSSLSHINLGLGGSVSINLNDYASDPKGDAIVEWVHEPGFSECISFEPVVITNEVILTHIKGTSCTETVEFEAIGTGGRRGSDSVVINVS